MIPIQGSMNLIMQQYHIHVQLVLVEHISGQQCFKDGVRVTGSLLMLLNCQTKTGLSHTENFTKSDYNSHKTQPNGR